MIGGKRSYREIERQLLKKGFHNIYIMELMEEQESDVALSTLEIQKKYAIECKEKPLDKNKIVMYLGMTPDHIVAIAEQLSKRSGLDIVWVTCKKIEVVPESIRVVYEGDWEKYIYELETAKVWIYDTTLPLFSIKRKEQIGLKFS